MPEPPIGIEPMTYALREARALTAHALAALIARANGTDGTGGAGITRRPGPRTGPRPRPCVHAILLLCVNAADDMDPRPHADTAPGPAADLYAAAHTVRLADARNCRNESVTRTHTSACRTNPGQSSSAARSGAPREQGWQIWGSSRSARRLRNRLTYAPPSIFIHGSLNAVVFPQ